jgi:hypothetical protein
MTRSAANAVAALTAVMVLLALGPAAAQDISARDRQAASEAYDRGTSAYLARNYADAARWFETAHRLAPAAAALVQAVRAAQRAGDDLRVANLGLRLQALYPDDRPAQRAATDALRNARRFVRVDVECTGCTLAVDGAVVEHTSFFVAPGASHTVEAAFDTGSRTETVEGAAGEQRSLRFERPEPPVVEPDPEPPPVAEPVRETPVVTPVASSSGVIPLPVTIGAFTVTAVLAGVLVWSGLDTLDGVPGYVANPTAEALADGQSREARTNWLIGGTLVAAAASVVLAIFTDWNLGGSSAGTDVALDVGIQADGAMAGLRGRF